MGTSLGTYQDPYGTFDPLGGGTVAILPSLVILELGRLRLSHLLDLEERLNLFFISVSLERRTVTLRMSFGSLGGGTVKRSPVPSSL